MHNTQWLPPASENGANNKQQARDLMVAHLYVNCGSRDSKHLFSKPAQASLNE